MASFIAIFERLMTFFAWAAAWLFVLSGLMLSYEVVARYFFLSPTRWAAELSQLCLIYGTLLAMPWILQHRRNIQINAVTAKLPDQGQRGIGIVTMAILIVFCTYVTVYGWDIFYDSFERGRTTGSLLDMPSWVAELPVPTFFGLLAIQAVIEIGKLMKGHPIPTGGHE
jgi:C4-dicarboxylate transporter DctQ subunit